MRRFYTSALFALLPLEIAGLLMFQPLIAQKAVPRSASIGNGPGDAIYTPTKLEWATLELQATYGNNSWTTDSPVTISFIAEPDGKTVSCLFQYTADLPAAALKIDRDSISKAFEKYVQSRGWTWLRLEIQERVIK